MRYRRHIKHAIIPIATQLESGFTLLEVLVALVILAVTLGTTLKITGERFSAYEESRLHLIARWVAHNQLAQLKQNPQDLVGRSGTETQAGSNFIWHREALLNPRNQTISINIRVTNEAGHEYARYQGWLPVYTRPSAPRP